MGHVTLVTGQAGTGKTTWLLNKANEFGPKLITSEHQKMLAITRMHGARRRLELNLNETCPNIPRTVTTIDSFALTVLNRWRMTIGHQKPLMATSGADDFSSTLFGVDVGFDRVRIESGRLLQSRTVGSIIGESYPLILVDEFQDCHGSLLEFVVALSRCSTLLLAADDFQLLDSAVTGCPAVHWVNELQTTGNAVIEELKDFHRTSSVAILEAARCLRDNVRSISPTIPVIYCPSHGPAAWKIVENLVCCSTSTRWTGTCALICPSHDPFLQKVLDSCSQQLSKRNFSPISWRQESSSEEERKTIFTLLGLTEESSKSDGEWCIPIAGIDPLAEYAVSRAKRNSKLRGLDRIPQNLVIKEIDKTIHDRRAYCASSPQRTVTTVHGAKNREFDNVFILWPYRLPPSAEQQRRWLYNAVTRSKKNCIILVLGSAKRINDDPVLSLLGPPQPAFKRKAIAEHRVAKKKVSK